MSLLPVLAFPSFVTQATSGSVPNAVNHVSTLQPSPPPHVGQPASATARLTVSVLAGSTWHTLLAFGSNFDNEGLYSFRRMSWPASFAGTSLQQLADADFYQCGSKEAFQDMFRTDGKPHSAVFVCPNGGFASAQKQGAHCVVFCRQTMG